jgi:electron transfer flavoprotein beta subunit
MEWKDEGHLTAHREIEGAAEVVEVTLPAVLTANKGLNEPRYPKLPGIMKAKKIPIEEMTAAALGLEAAEVGSAGARAVIARLEPPPPRTEGKKFVGDPREAVVSVLRSLHDERKLL